ncbi:MAG: PQQ-binding-like beta-propeller repeat protein [Acidobacteria bacterium]|nr:PQQ-binding-like beta-propeller repeat protein [Acidobacteriota bacterium]
MKRGRFGCGVLALAAFVCIPHTGSAQLTGVQNGQWGYLGGDAGHTRSSPLTQINVSNFSKLQVAWIWRGDNFGPGTEYTFRSTPVYAGGVLYTVAGQRRQVAAIDAATGETLWTFREPETTRYLRSPRSDFGKGVAYAEVDGRGVIYISSPAFFLWALDAKTGKPLENWGTPVPLKGFPRTGVVDMIPDLIRDWEPWLKWKGGPYDPDYGIPRQLGMITASSPPIVVNGVVVVLSGGEPTYDQTRIENVPSDIQGYDARTGKHLWKFHVIPRPGEPGHDTWLNDAWRWSGDMHSWAPASADPERGLVYIVTNSSTYQVYTGHRPGENLFGGSLLALDVKTGRRKWHFQIHRSDQWNYDIPTAPILMDLTVGGRRIPAVVQNTKQGLVFAFNRETGAPIWPIEDRPVTQTEVPGNYTAKTQPYPTRPEPLDPIVWNGITEEFVIDYTPELKRRAMEILSKFRVGGLYVPPLPYPHKNSFINNVGCQGGLNIYHPPVADPTSGIMYAPHSRSCNAPPYLVPTGGVDVERTEFAGKSAESWRGRERVTPTTGTTVAAWKQGDITQGRLPTIDGLPVYKPLYQGLAAYDMNTGARLWDLPVGQTPARVRNHPLLKGVTVPNTGGTGNAVLLVTGSLLLQTSEDLRGEAESNEKGLPLLHARDKRTGQILASVPIPIPGQYGMMTYMHDGKQYIVVQAGSARRNQPGSLVALTLP